MDELFETLTDEQIKELSPEDLEARERELRERYAEVRGGDLNPEALGELNALAEHIDQAGKEKERREQEQADIERQAAELDARVTPEAEEPKAEDGDDKDGDKTESKDEDGKDGEKEKTTVETQTTVEKEPEAEKEAEKEPERLPVAASAIAARRPSNRGPRQDGRPRLEIVASADIPGIPAGGRLEDFAEVGKALILKWEAYSKGIPRGRIPEKRHTGADGQEYVTVASIKFPLPEDRMLGDNLAENEEKLALVASPDAIVAAGGICAPPTPFYDLPVIAGADRPVRDALPRFGAEQRGGVVFMPPPALTDVAGAIRATTQAQDAAGYGDGLTANKPCLSFECDEATTVYVEAISRCLEFGNFNERFYPERIRAFIDLARAYQARYAEGRLLDRIAAASTEVTSPQTYGAARTVLSVVSQAAAGMRSRLRIPRRVMLRAPMPDWSKDVIAADLARTLWGSDTEVGVTDAQIEGWLRARGVVPTFYLDEETGENQIFPAETGGELNGFPDVMRWFLFPEGSHRFLDGGELDLGIVRDSVTNVTNDFQIFAETFESSFSQAVESLVVETTLCPDGTYGPAASAITCAPGAS